MYDIFRVQILDPQANVNEYFPHEVFNEVSFLFFYVTAQVVVVAVLHHYVYVSVVNKGVEVTNNEVAVEPCHQIDLCQRVDRIRLHLSRGVNHLNHVALISQ